MSDTIKFPTSASPFHTNSTVTVNTNKEALKAAQAANTSSQQLSDAMTRISAGGQLPGETPMLGDAVSYGGRWRGQSERMNAAAQEVASIRGNSSQQRSASASTAAAESSDNGSKIGEDVASMLGSLGASSQIGSDEASASAKAAIDQALKQAGTQTRGSLSGYLSKLK